METTRRSSKQRDLIYEIVRCLRSHPTADEVYQIAKMRSPQVSLGTVYRNLKLLVDDGKIKEVLVENGKTRFDGVEGDHDHFICNKCGVVTDISHPPAGRQIGVHHPDLQGMSVSGYRLTYYGLCRDCTQASEG